METDADRLARAREVYAAWMAGAEGSRACEVEPERRVTGRRVEDREFMAWHRREVERARFEGFSVAVRVLTAIWAKKARGRG